MEIMLILIFGVLFYIALLFSFWTVYLDRKLSKIQDKIDELTEIIGMFEQKINKLKADKVV